MYLYHDDVALINMQVQATASGTRVMCCEPCIGLAS